MCHYAKPIFLNNQHEKYVYYCNLTLQSISHHFPKNLHNILHIKLLNLILINFDKVLILNPKMHLFPLCFLFFKNGYLDPSVSP